MQELFRQWPTCVLDLEISIVRGHLNVASGFVAIIIAVRHLLGEAIFPLEASLNDRYIYLLTFDRQVGNDSV